MVLQNIQPKAVARIGFLAIILIVAGFATIPYAIQASLQGAPLGQPTLSSPYVQSAAKMHLTFTYYFYWYNYATGMGFSAPNCTSANILHPVNETGVSYLDPNWDVREFEDMIEAGIDVFLPDYWGNSSWSIAGLPVMQTALDYLHSSNYNAANIRNVTNPIPKVGLFFDTTSMENEFHSYDSQGNMITTADLTNAKCLEWFYGYIRDFFAQFNSSRIEQIPNADNASAPTAYIVWLYGANYFIHTGHAASNYCKARFLSEFNHTLVFIGTPDWVQECPQIDGIYQWGTAINGCMDHSDSPIRIASIGAGMNNGNSTEGAVCGANEPVIRVPRTPANFENNWTTAIADAPNWIVIETWNEIFEGTGICRTVEYGRYLYPNLRKLQYSVSCPALANKMDINGA